MPDVPTWDTRQIGTPRGLPAAGGSRLYVKADGELYILGADGSERRASGSRDVTAVASGTSGTVALDCSAASIFTLSPTGDVTTLTISNPAALGRSTAVTLIVTQDATPRSIATPAGGVFMGAASPTQVANKACIFTYLTADAGATWYCSASVQS